jgi:hypothetical protein
LAEDWVREREKHACASHVLRVHGKSDPHTKKRQASDRFLNDVTATAQAHARKIAAASSSSSESSSSAEMEPPAPKRRRTDGGGGQITMSANMTHTTGTLLVPASVFAPDAPVAASPAAAAAPSVEAQQQQQQPPKTPALPVDTLLADSLPKLPSLHYGTLGVSQSSITTSMHIDLPGFDLGVDLDNDLLSQSQRQPKFVTFDDLGVIHEGMENSMLTLTQPKELDSSSSSSSSSSAFDNLPPAVL